MSIAYRVRDEYADAGFEGGALAVNDGETFHLGEALAKGNGYVVVDDEDSGIAFRLSEQPALEQCDVDKAQKAQKQAKPAVKVEAKEEVS
jgi:hypothetical protein